jgi:hypothetical protein
MSREFFGSAFVNITIERWPIIGQALLFVKIH